MLSFTGRILLVLATLGLLLGGPLATTAGAEKKSKVIQTEAKWVAFDPAAKTVTARVTKTGKKPKNKDLKLKKGQNATFNVKPEGSVLTRTTVKINGLGGKLTDVEPGKTVNIYWIPDEKNKDQRFARSIDVTLSREEWEARTKAVD